MTPLLPTPDYYLHNLITMTSSDSKRLWRRAVKQHFNCQCVYCGKHYEENELTLDHVTPLSRGGETRRFHRSERRGRRVHVRDGGILLEDSRLGEMGKVYGGCGHRRRRRPRRRARVVSVCRVFRRRAESTVIHGYGSRRRHVARQGMHATFKDDVHRARRMSRV